MITLQAKLLESQPERWLNRLPRYGSSVFFQLKRTCKRNMSRTWQLKHSLETSCSSEELYSGVDVWIKRPNVINRKLLGAVIRLEGTLSSAWASKDPLTSDHVTVVQLLQKPEEEGVASCSRIVVRELLPRLGHVCPALELVVVGTLGNVFNSNC